MSADRGAADPLLDDGWDDCSAVHMQAGRPQTRRSLDARRRHGGTVAAMPLALTDPRLVTTWTALLARGVSPDHIRAQLDAGRWRRWGYAIALHNGPLSREQRWFVARRHAGPHALLTAFTAAEAFGLRGWERPEVHLLGPGRAVVSSRCPVPVRLHRRRTWSSVVSWTGGLHRFADALLVAASTFASPRPGCGLLAAAVQQARATVPELQAALADVPTLRHHRSLAAAVHDVAQGSQALSEIDFVRLCRRFGLPAPQQQTVRREASGRRRFLDATWRRTDGRLVVVEVDGALHLAVRTWWDDQLRQNEVTLSDALVLRFPSVVVRNEPEVVAIQLGRALGVRPRIAGR